MRVKIFNSITGKFITYSMKWTSSGDIFTEPQKLKAFLLVYLATFEGKNWNYVRDRLKSLYLLNFESKKKSNFVALVEKHFLGKDFFICSHCGAFNLKIKNSQICSKCQKVDKLYERVGYELMSVVDKENNNVIKYELVELKGEELDKRLKEIKEKQKKEERHVEGVL